MAFRQQFLELHHVFGRDIPCHRVADDSLDRRAEQGREAGVAVEDRSFRAEGGRPLLHLLDEQSVGGVGRPSG